MKEKSEKNSPLKIALIGGTHGNERLGVEIVSNWQQGIPFKTPHTIEPFILNFEAVKRGLRYVDHDLNRCFGRDSKPVGYEAERTEELKQKIIGNYDLIIDLHSRTSNMGFTIILPKTDPLSRQVALYLKMHFREITIVESIVVFVAFFTYRDKDNNYIPHKTIDTWVNENTQFLDIGCAVFNIKGGRLISLAVSAEEMGYYSAKELFKIVTQNKEDITYSIRKKIPLSLVINKDRAHKVGIEIPYTILTYAGVSNILFNN